ncbi:MAG: four helix bundle protein [Flavobacteriaceae bacterium]|nr:four helix bundle protein [Flavobacteriaceae bacterium]
MRNFKNFEIWNNGIKLVKLVYEISDKLPEVEKYGLKSQLTRAAISVPSNIAEGCSRNSEIEFKRFLEMALGSLFEVETHLIVIHELNFISQNELIVVMDLIEKEGKMINTLINKIKTANGK